MAITTTLELWQAAATEMGETGTLVVTSQASPSKPVELTFDSFYDRLRKSMLRKIQPLFARRHATLREAPYVKSNGDEQTWSDRWKYVYIEPSESIEFLGFRADYPDLGLVKDFIKRRLPIQYVAVQNTGVGASGYYTWAASDMGGSMYRNSLWVSITDESYDEHEIVDIVNNDPGNTYPNEFQWDDPDVSDPLPNTMNSYDDDNTIVLPVAGFLDYSFPTSAYPANVTLNAGIYPTDTDDWAEHILTDHDDAVGEYIVDVTDVSKWSEEFQNAVVVEMARKAARVHAKSAKLMQALAQERAMAISEAITQDASEDDNLEDKRMSSAERARQ